MKTSNIIILAVFVFIIVVSIWNMLVIKDNLEEKLKLKEESLVVEDISDFRTVVVSDNVNLKIFPSKKNKLEYYSEDTVRFRVYYDTLFVQGSGDLLLKVNTLFTIILKDNVTASIKNWNELHCELQMNDNTVFKAESIHTQHLKLIMLNNNLLKINDSRIDTLDFKIDNNNIAKIKDTKLKRAVGEVGDNTILSIPYVKDWFVNKKGNAVVNIK